MISSQGAVSFDSIRHNAQLGFQLKATSAEVLTDTPEFTYPLPIKNYNDLRLPSTIPRLLVVYVMPQDSSHWLTYHEPEEHLIQRRCAYWLDLFGSQEVSNETSRTISIPRCNVLTVRGVDHADGASLEIGDRTCLALISPKTFFDASDLWQPNGMRRDMAGIASTCRRASLSLYTDWQPTQRKK